MEKKSIDISTGIIWRTIFILIAMWVLYLLGDVIALLIISIIVVAAIDPVVDWLQRKRIPRAAGVSLVYLGILLVFGLAVSFIIPPIINQASDFSENFSSYSQKIEAVVGTVKNFFQAQHLSFNIEEAVKGMVENFSTLPEKILTGTIGVFSGFISLAVIFSMAFYMTVKENGIRSFVISVVPEKHKEYAASITDRIKVKIGMWMRGQLLLMLAIFILVFIGLSIAKVPYALSLALFAGIMEIVPYIGPIVSAIPGVIFGFLVSPLTGLIALIVYVVAQQLENNVLVPQVMKKVLGLHPVAVILALLVGAKLGGVLGAILSIPMATALKVFVDDLMSKSEKAECEDTTK